MTQRTSEEVMREEFERLWKESIAATGDYAVLISERSQHTGKYFSIEFEAAWRGFQLGQKSLAGKVPVEALQISVGWLDGSLGGYDSDALNHYAKQLEKLLDTIRSLQ